MPNNPLTQLGRRERQIMDIVLRLGPAKDAEVLAELPDPPSYSAVRGMLGLLKEKGYLKYEQEGARYVYLPAVDVEQVKRSALRDVVNTFFDGSREAAVAALLGDSRRLSGAELDRLAEMIEAARREGGRS